MNLNRTSSIVSFGLIGTLALSSAACGAGQSTSDPGSSADDTLGAGGSGAGEAGAGASSDEDPGPVPGETGGVDAGGVGRSRVVGSSGGSSPGELDGGGEDETGAGNGNGNESGTTPTSSSAWVMGYYANWDSNVYPPSSVYWEGLTHIATAFYWPDANGTWDSGSFQTSTANAIIATAHAHGVKAIASVGGASTGQLFEAAMQGHEAQFLATLHGLITQGYDGVDIDWEGGDLTLAQDYALETTLITQLRAQNPGIVITLTAGTENQNYPDDLSFYVAIAPLVDRISLMTYGMSGTYPGWKSWHSSPLHWNQDPTTPVGIDGTVAIYEKAGVPPGKIAVGAGFYGECFTSPVVQPDMALGGSYVNGGDDSTSYATVRASYWSPSVYHWDDAAQVPYLALDGNNPQSCTFLSYENPRSLRAKGAWVKAKGVGGLIIWTLSEGFVSSGATVAAQNPLLVAVRKALLL